MVGASRRVGGPGASPPCGRSASCRPAAGRVDVRDLARAPHLRRLTAVPRSGRGDVTPVADRRHPALCVGRGGARAGSGASSTHRIGGVRDEGGQGNGTSQEQEGTCPLVRPDGVRRRRRPRSPAAVTRATLTCRPAPAAPAAGVVGSDVHLENQAAETSPPRTQQRSTAATSTWTTRRPSIACRRRAPAAATPPGRHQAAEIAEQRGPPRRQRRDLRVRTPARSGATTRATTTSCPGTRRMPTR